MRSRVQQPPSPVTLASDCKVILMFYKEHNSIEIFCFARRLVHYNELCLLHSTASPSAACCYESESYSIANMSPSDVTRARVPRFYELQLFSSEKLSSCEIFIACHVLSRGCGGEPSCETLAYGGSVC